MPSFLPLSPIENDPSADLASPVAINAAVLAAQIIATSDPKFAKKLEKYNEELAQAVAEKSAKVKREFQG